VIRGEKGRDVQSWVCRGLVLDVNQSEKMN
jgi:hypothetical protein